MIACSLVMNFLFPLAYVRQTKLSVCEIISLSGGVSVWCGGVQLAATTRDGLMNNSSRNWTPLKTTWRDWDRRLITETDRRLINKTDRQLITETGDWSDGAWVWSRQRRRRLQTVRNAKANCQADRHAPEAASEQLWRPEHDYQCQQDAHQGRSTQENRPYQQYVSSLVVMSFKLILNHAITKSFIRFTL